MSRGVVELVLLSWVCVGGGITLLLLSAQHCPCGRGCHRGASPNAETCSLAALSAEAAERAYAAA